MIKYILLCLSILFSFTGVLGAGHPTRLQRLQQMRQSLGSLESNGRIDPERAQQISEEIRELEASEIREMIRSTRTPSRALNLIPIIKDKEYPIYAEVTTGRETRYRKKDSTHHEQIEMDYLKTEIYYYYNGRYNKKPNTEAKFFFWFYDGTTFFPMQVSLIHLNTLQCTSTKADGTKESVHVQIKDILDSNGTILVDNQKYFFSLKDVSERVHNVIVWPRNLKIEEHPTEQPSYNTTLTAEF